jgi:uncharacterized protein
MTLIASILAASALSPASAAEYAPLNCARASSADERAICGDYALGQREARMATLYQWATSFVAMGQRGDIEDKQRAFLKSREACGADRGCLLQAYDARIAQLQRVMESVREKGPF